MKLSIGGILLLVAVIIFVAVASRAPFIADALLPIGLAFLAGGLLLDGARR